MASSSEQDSSAAEPALDDVPFDLPEADERLNVVSPSATSPTSASGSPLQKMVSAKPGKAKAAPHPEGIVFGMPEALYHADPSLGSTSLKQLGKTASDYWWDSHMNDLRDAEDEDKKDGKHFLWGSAFHKLVLEGRPAFDAAYTCEPEMNDVDGIMSTADHLKDYLRREGLVLKGNRPELVERVREHWLANNEPSNPCPIWEDVLERASDFGKKTLLKPNIYRQILLSARMVTSNPSLRDWLGKDVADGDEVLGFSEVSVFWREHVQVSSGEIVEVPCKCRFDRLGLKPVIDLKTIANKDSLPLDLTVPKQIHALRYDLQRTHYMEGRERARHFIKQGKVFAADDAITPPAYWLKAFERIRALKPQEDAATTNAYFWAWIFVQKTGAPIAQSFTLDDPDSWALSASDRNFLLMRYAENRARFGTGMWMHITPVTRLTLSDMPSWRRFHSALTDRGDAAGAATTRSPSEADGDDFDGPDSDHVA